MRCSVCNRNFATAEALNRHLDATGHRRGNMGTSRPRNTRNSAPRPKTRAPENRPRTLPLSETAPANTRRITMELKPNTSADRAVVGYSLRVGGGSTGTAFTGLTIGDQVKKVSIAWEGNLVNPTYTCRWVAILASNAKTTYDVDLIRKISQLGGAMGSGSTTSLDAAVLHGTPYEVQAGLEKFIVIALEHVGGPTTPTEAGVFKVHIDVAGAPTTNTPLL